MQIPIVDTPLSRIQQSYMAPLNDNIVNGWCPISKLQGPAESRRPGLGVAWGPCPSQYVDTRDASLSCMFENNLSKVAWSTSSGDGRVTVAQVSPTSNAMIGRPATFTVPANFGINGAISMAHAPGGLAGSWDSGSGVQGPVQNASYGSYSACNSCSSGYDTTGFGTCASKMPPASACGASNGTRYWTQVDASEQPNYMMNNMGYGGM